MESQPGNQESSFAATVIQPGAIMFTRSHPWLTLKRAHPEAVHVHCGALVAHPGALGLTL